MQRVVLLTGNHLCHNPRVVKEADTLHDAGWQVQVLGGWMDTTLAARDRELCSTREWKFIPVVDCSDGGTAWTSHRNRLRARAKIGRLLGKFGFENAWQLGYGAPELLAAARRSDSSLFIAHSEAGMWAASRLQRGGRAVGVDMEDWFSEDLLPEARRGRPVRLIRALEQTLLRNGQHQTCTSRAMSESLAAEFGGAAPAVIYNTFPWDDRRSLDGLCKDRRDRRVPSLHWFSQTVGPGRGLEELFQALPHVRPALEIHLRGETGSCGANWIRGLIPESWQDRVLIHPLVSNAELLSRIAEHDIGFAGESKFCRSRDLTVTNKLFQYLLGGLAVVASDTSGQREIAAAGQGGVIVYPSGDAQALAAVLNRLLESPQLLAQTKKSALRAAEDTYCWEKCSGRLTGLVRKATFSSES